MDWVSQKILYCDILGIAVARNAYLWFKRVASQSVRAPLLAVLSKRGKMSSGRFSAS